MFKSNPTPEYSIIIPAFNEAAFLTRTLDAVARAMQGSGRESGEVIVVDNNSSDDTVVVAQGHRALAHCLQVVHEPVNQISRARNCGAAHARSNLLLFIDADTSINAVLLEAALVALSNEDVVGGGALLEIDRRHRVGDFATGVWNRFARWAKYAAGCFVFCRKDAFDEVGGFSEKVYASEEIWLARALKKFAKPIGAEFIVLEHHAVTSARKLEWLSTFAMLKQILVITLFPFALKHKRFCSAWYQRPD